MTMPAAKPEIWFYQLERSSIEEALPPLLEKCGQRGWKALIKCETAEQAKTIDITLWTYRANAWLPHGYLGDETLEQPERQPVLIGETVSTNLNKAEALFLVEGANRFDDLAHIARIFVLFSAQDETALQKARADWKRGKADGFEQSYWRQDDGGKWIKQA